MIPALLDYCVKEVEHRGLSEVGLYRVPGNETEATELLEKFLQGRGPPPRYYIKEVSSPRTLNGPFFIQPVMVRLILRPAHKVAP